MKPTDAAIAPARTLRRLLHATQGQAFAGSELDEVHDALTDIFIGLAEIKDIAQRPMGSVAEKGQALSDIAIKVEMLRGD